MAFRQHIVRALSALLLWATASAGCANEDRDAVEAVEGLAAIFTAKSGDCEAMAIELGAYRKQHEAALGRLAEIRKKPEAERTAFDDAYRARVEAASGTILDGAMPCLGNAEVEEAAAAVQ